MTQFAQDDAEWFASHPDRNYRIRLATPLEIEIESDGKEPVPDGFRVYAIIWQMRPGVRAHVYMLSNTGDQADATEEKAKTLFTIAATLDDANTLH
jgi:hypothetical protein